MMVHHFHFWKVYLIVKQKLLNMINNITKTFVLIGLALFITSCSNDDDVDVNVPQGIPLFSEEDKFLIHGDDQKSWRIVEVVDDYYDPNDDLAITTACVVDDIYTFTAGEEAVDIDYGEILCFEDVSAGIFTADDEFFESNLKTLQTDFSETIYLHFAYGYMNESQTALASTFTHYRLTELSDTLMVFTKGTEFLGDYKEALIFELIQ